MFMTPECVAPTGCTLGEGPLWSPSEGCLWTCLWDASRVIRLTPDGEIDRIIVLAATRPTSVAFGDDDLKTLFITTARSGLSFPQLDARPLSGSLFAIRVDVPGLPPREFGKPL